ncbi:MAG TPA: SET domain-containing protein [Candidatus Paceibacterota bacterium]|nr:SET domain-containing protein [Candidatus Paceibacterota bacterium]
MKDIYICNSKIQGKGVHAGEDIKKGELIQYVKGEVKFLTIKDENDSKLYPNWIGIGKNKWINVNYPHQYLNHSCNPNSSIRGKVSVVALKDIKEGDEITIDYSVTECDEFWEMDCACEAKNCRKVIKSIQYLPKKTFDKYMPYIPTYFRNFYLKTKKLKK